MKPKSLNPNIAIIYAFLFALPFVVINFIVSLRVEPFYSFLGSFPVIRNSLYFPLFLLALLPVGAYFSIRPVLQKGEEGKRKFYMLNIATAAILLMVFLLLFAALSEEMYRCEVLKIPNCD